MVIAILIVYIVKYATHCSQKLFGARVPPPEDLIILILSLSLSIIATLW